MKVLLSVAALGAVMASQAVTFTNVIIGSAPLSTGSSYSVSGNSISFFTPNAVIVEGVPAPSQVLNIQYDVCDAAGINGIGANISAVTSGSGIVSFLEQVIELDSNGNELGSLGSMTATFTPNGSPIFSGSLSLNGTYECLRVKKSFVLAAPATTNGLDLAAVAIVNQSVQVVPEPATMTALGLGIAALARRRRSK